MNPIHPRIVVGFLLVASLAIDPLPAEDWPNRRGPSYNGISRERLAIPPWPDGGPTVLWRTQIGVGFSGITVAQNAAFTMGNQDNQDTVYCFDLQSGNLRWKHTYDSPLEDRFFEGGPTSTPTFSDGRLYTLGRNGDLHCFDATTGEVVWNKDIANESGCRIPGWGFSSSPVVHGPWLLLGVGDAGTAIDKSNGEIRWQSGKGEAGYMTPFLHQLQDRWIAIIASGKFYQAIDVDTGEQLWRHRWLTTYGCNAADPIVSGDRVLISSGYGRGAALLKISDQAAEVIWETKELANQLNSSVLIGESIFGFHGDEGGEVELRCLNIETGALQWSEPGLGSGSVIGAGGELLLLSETGELIIAPASADSLRPRARAKILDGKCWTVPTLSHGRVLARNATGDLVCVEVQVRSE